MAQFDQELRIADVYAEALFTLAQEQQRVAELQAELDELLKLWDGQPDFAKFMSSPALEADARARGLEKMFRGTLDDIVLNTLLVMNDHGRSALVPALHRRFVLRKEDASNEIEVRITSAFELPDEQKAEAIQIAVEASNRKPVVEYRVEPDILGGLILQVGELRLDNSLRRHVNVLSKNLFDRADRGLEVGVVE